MNARVYKAHLLQVAREYFDPDVEEYLAPIAAADLLQFAEQLGRSGDGACFGPDDLAAFIRTQR